MKNLLILLAIFCAVKINAQDYHITFGGTGASANVSTVRVENLTQGTSLIVNGSDILHLTSITTGINSFEVIQSSEIKIYPNPMHDNSTIEINPPIAGEAIISVLDMSGRPIAQIHSYLENYKQEFRISGLNSGVFIINIRGSSYQYSGKLLCNSNSGGTISILKISSDQTTDEKPIKSDKKGTQATVEMAYNTGDRLKFTGLSAPYSAVKTDIPTSDQTVNFNFIACTDGDNNNYAVVEIGDQTWMAENLKTTKYRNGDLIGTTTPGSLNITGESSPKYQWAFGANENNVATYGRLYTWYSATDTRNVCPTGWHVPTDGELTTLTTELGGESEAGGKLKETGTAHWFSPNIATNETGFTERPGGHRGPSGTFYNLGDGGWWWSSSADDASKAWYRLLTNNVSSIDRISASKSYGFSIRCIKGEGAILPGVITNSPFGVTCYTAYLGGDISSEGATKVTAKGVCWSTTPNPTISNSDTTIVIGDGSFTSRVTGLLSNTLYYYRAYATNSAGTSYGNQLSFLTRIPVTDADGNVYNTTIIGTQTWMAENLKTTKYRDGSDIEYPGEDYIDWINNSTGAYAWYVNNVAYKTLLGALYNWNAVHTGKLCPTGWHVPSDAEWTELTDSLGGESVAGDKLKISGRGWWLGTMNTKSTNETSFTGIPGGYRSYDQTFDDMGLAGFWWSSSESDGSNAWYRIMNYSSSSVFRRSDSKIRGYSIRCLKN